MSLGRGQSPVLYEAGPCMGGWVLYKWDGTCMGGTCTMRPTASWVLVTWDPLNRKTDTCENITFPQLHWRAVKIRENIESILKSKGRKVKGNSGSLQQDFKSIILELLFIQVSHSVATNEAAREHQAVSFVNRNQCPTMIFTALKHTEPFVPEPICTPFRILQNLSVINLSSNMYIKDIVDFIKSDV